VARPDTIENRWDILYRDYPEVYEDWARIPTRPTFVQVIDQHFPVRGKSVVDVGAGSGRSTFELARCADFVVGVEPEDAMRAIAIDTQRREHVANVRFVKGVAEDLPLGDRSTDVVAAITLASAEVERDAREMERVARLGGLVLRLDVAPGWYGGDLSSVITGRPREEVPPRGSVGSFEYILNDALTATGYDHIDIFMDQDYGTVERAVQTYGFIFGKRAIDYLEEHRKTQITWKFRLFYKRIGSRPVIAGASLVAPLLED